VVTIPEELFPVLPELVVVGGAALLLGFARIDTLSRRAGDVALLVVALAAVASVGSLGTVDVAQGWALRGFTVADPFAALFRFLLAVVAMATVWLSTRSREPGGATDAIGWSLFLVALLGAFTIAAAAHALAAWAGFAVTGLATAAWMARRAQTDAITTEGADVATMGPGVAAATTAPGAAVSMFLYVAIAAALLLIGLAMLHALAGTLSYASMPGAVVAALAAPGGSAAAFAAIALVLLATAFGLGSAPWQQVRADLASRSSLPVTAWVAVGGTLCGVVLLARFVRGALVTGEALSSSGAWSLVEAGPWPALLSVVAMATMLESSVRALRERDLRRLASWLFAAQSGALLMAFVAPGHLGFSALLFHAVAFAMAAIGLLAALTPVLEQLGGPDIESLRGLARRGRSGRAMAAAIAIFVFSLTALPPFAGYVGRTLLFAEAFEEGRVWLAGAAAVASALGVLVAIRLLATMLDRPAAPEREVQADFESALLAGLLLAGTVLAGVVPSVLQALTDRAVVFFAG
jgi:NADH-quinone oxidoreductase subunit N